MVKHRRNKVPDGSYVVIRAWEDMEDEFGHPSNCDFSFVSGMKIYSGRVFQIKTSRGVSYGGSYTYSYEFVEGNNDFAWSADMFDVIECPYEEDDTDCADLDLSDLLS